MGVERDYESIPITWEAGLLESVEDSMLPPGSAAVLKNWQADPSGNLRSRIGWSLGSTASAPAARKGVGIGYFSRLLTPGIVQSSAVAVVKDAGSSPDPAPTWPLATTKGSLLLLATGINNSDGTTTAPTITGWTQAVISADTSGRPRNAIYYKANAASESGSVTAGWSGLSAGGEAAWAQLYEISGITPTSPLDVTASTTAAADATPDSGTTAATAQSVEFVLAVLADQRLETMSSPTNNFVEITQGQIDTAAGVDINFGSFYRTTTATGAQSTSVTTSTADDVAGCIAAFKGWYTGTPSAGQLSATEFLVAQNDTTEYDFFAVDRDTISSDTWASPGSIAAADPSQLVAMAPGFGRVWITNTQFSGTYFYDGATLTAVASSPAGRAIAVHKNRVFVAGTNANPGRLYFSEINDGATWDMSGTTTTDTAGFIDVERDTGEPIEDITPFEDGLVIGKRTGLWYLTGSGDDTFRLVRLPIGGVAPGRTILPTPNGALCFGRKHIWLFTGDAVETLTAPVRDTYGMTGTWLTSSFINNVAYVCDQGSGTIWAISFEDGTWRQETLGSASTEGPACIYNHDDMQVFAPKNATVGSLLNYRNMPGSTRIKDFGTLSEAFEAWTPEMWLVGPEEKFTPRYLFYKIRDRLGDNAAATLTVTPYVNGTAATARTIGPFASPGVYRGRISLAENAVAKGIASYQLRITSTATSTNADTYDIEELVIGYNVEAVR